MRRLALPVASLIAFTGLTVVAIPHEPARASDLSLQPTTQQCLDDSPYPRSAPLAQRDALSLDEEKPNGNTAYARNIVNQNGVGISSIVGPSNASGSALAASTSAQLAGMGAESIVRLTGAKGAAPTVAIDAYSAGEPTTANMASISPATSGLAPADDVAVTAADFRTASDAEWASRGLVVEPDEVAIASRSPYSSSNPETIKVQLYAPSLDGRALSAYGSAYSLSGEFKPIDGYRQDLLAMTSADMDLDGDPEIVLAYSWGAWDQIRVDVLNISNPDNPTLQLVARTTYAGPTAGSWVSQISVDAGLFGQPATAIALGWQVSTNQEDSSYRLRAPAQLKTLVLPHPTGQKPPQLPPPSDLSPRPLTETGSRTFMTESGDESWSAATFRMAVGDIDMHKLARGTSIFGQGKDEIAVAYAYGNQVTTEVLDPTTSQLATRWSASDAVSDPWPLAHGVTVGVADLDGDADNDVVVAYGTNNGSHRLLWYSLSPDGTQLQLRSSTSPQLGSGSGNLLPIVMSDVGNQSIRMIQRRVGRVCADAQVPIMLTAADGAPFWQTLGSDAWWGMTTVGNGVTGGTSQSKTVTDTASDSATFSVGYEAELPSAGFGDVAPQLEIELSDIGEETMETSTTQGTEQSQSISFSASQSNYGFNQDMRYDLVTYRCYYFELDTPTGSGLRGSFRQCDIVGDEGDVSTGLQHTIGWESGNAPNAPSSDYAWAPFRDEWTNLAYALPYSAASLSGSASAAGAIDGNKDPLTPSTVAATSAQPNPWWQLRLNAPEDVGLVRVYPAGLDICSGDCVDSLRDFDVYVFNDETLAQADMATLKAAAVNNPSSVAVFHYSGGPAKVANVVTRNSSSLTAANGKYIRVQMTAPNGVLQLAEVQAYRANDRMMPTEYPSDVRVARADEVAGLSDKNVFVASVWDPSQQRYVDRLISGQLMPMTNPAPSWSTITNGTCNSYSPLNWSRSDSTDTTYGRSTSDTQGIGMSADVKAGPDVFAVKATGQYMHNWGWENSESVSTSLGKDFTIEWARGNYCKRDADGNPVTGYSTSAACTYEIKPFYYMQEEWSNAGFQQVFPHVSYQVRMDRSKDLTDCYDDHWRYGSNIRPQSPDIAAQTTSSAITVDPLANATDPNPEDAGRLVIKGVAAASTAAPATSATTAMGGTAIVASGKVTYNPPSGTWSSDSFYVTISDHDLDSLPIKVTVFRPGITNGTFSQGLGGWSKTGSWYVVGPVADGAPPLPGYYARGTIPSGAGTATLSQSFGVPSTVGKLVVWGRQGRSEDYLQVRVTSGSTSQVLPPVTNTAMQNGWRKYEYNVSAFKGKGFDLKLTASNADGYASTFDIDGISMY